MVGTCDVSENYLFWVVSGTAVFIVAVGLSVRVALDHERVIVTRLGRMVRVSGPGVVLRWPGLERLTTVSLHPAELHLVVYATTRDGIDVHVIGRAVCQITEPSRVAAADFDPFGATADYLERLLSKDVARTDLPELLLSRSNYFTELPFSATSATSAWGVEVTEIAIDDIDARLTSATLRTLDQDAHRGGG